MEFDLSLILLALPVAFVLGWMASRFDMRQLRMENRQAPKAYFKGLNFLLNEQQDQAIDAFIEAVQSDPDTSELHFALGILFRRRGEYERAVRVHQHLLSRGDLSLDDRHRAQHALALDYLKAGLLDRAEEALLKLEGTRFEAQARLALLANYERSRDWEHAAQIAQKLESCGQGSFKGRLSHYLCEQAATCVAANELPQALEHLTQAMHIAPEAPRPRMDLARLERQEDKPAQTTRVGLRNPAPGPDNIPRRHCVDCAIACPVRDRVRARRTHPGPPENGLRAHPLAGCARRHRRAGGRQWRTHGHCPGMVCPPPGK